MKNTINPFPCCPPEATKVVTVQTVDGIKGLNNCLVRVLDNNTVYYVDRQHNITPVSANIIEVSNYDANANPRNFRGQVAYDTETQDLIYFSYAGKPFGFGRSVSHADLEIINEKVNANTQAIVEVSAITNGNTQDIEALKEQVAKIDPEAIDAALEEVKTEVATATAIANSAEATATEAANQVEVLEATLDQTVQRNTTVSSDASTVNLVKTIGNIANNTTEVASISLPVASADMAGVMNTATFNAVQSNSENIDAILEGAVALNGISANVTHEELTELWKTATGLETLVNRASIYDVDNKKVWYYYDNTDNWYAINADNASVTVSQATNDTLGIVKGSTNPGQSFVEADGTMSLNGWDGVQHDLQNLTELIEGISVPNVGNFVVSGSPSENMIRISNEGGTRFLSFASRNTQTGRSKFENISFDSYPATPNLPGWMAASDKTKLDSLLEIKSIDDTLSLSAEGQLSAVGSGSGVNLLSTYMASPAEGDVYNAKYVNNRLDSGTVKIGVGATITGIYSGGIAIGNGATAASGSGDASIAIGGQLGTASAAKATHRMSIALGSNSITGRQRELSLGGGPASIATRYIANVTAGELDTDAVNLKQMKDYVAENAGNPFTEMETTRVQNLPIAVVTGFEDTAYNTDNITLHLDTKDLASGGLSVQELVLNSATAQGAGTTGNAGIMSALQATQLSALATELPEKQDKLVSGANIKTINGQSVLGSGDLAISGGGGIDETVLYEGNASTNLIELAESIYNFDRIKIYYYATINANAKSYAFGSEEFIPLNEVNQIYLSKVVTQSGTAKRVQGFSNSMFLASPTEFEVSGSILTINSESVQTVETSATSALTIQRIVGIGRKSS